MIATKPDEGGTEPDAKEMAQCASFQFGYPHFSLTWATLEFKQ